MIKNSVFDWSGTLQDDLKPVYQATMRVLARLGGPTMSLQQYRREFELPYTKFYWKYVKATREELDALFAEEFSSEKLTRVFKNADKVLEKLHENNVRMTILSAHNKKFLEEEVRRACFGGFFNEVKGSVHDKRLEIKEMMRKNAFAANETAYVGDMVHDIETARAAGVKAIAVSWGYTPRNLLEQAKPDWLVDEWNELENAFGCD